MPPSPGLTVRLASVLNSIRDIENGLFSSVRFFLKQFQECSLCTLSLWRIGFCCLLHGFNHYIYSILGMPFWSFSRELYHLLYSKSGNCFKSPTTELVPCYLFDDSCNLMPTLFLLTDYTKSFLG